MGDQFMTTVIANNRVPSTTGHHANNKRDLYVALFMLTLIIFLVGAVTLFITIYALSVSDIPNISQVSVETITLTNFNNSSNSLTSGNWEARIIVQTENFKFTLYYDQIQVDLLYKSGLISTTNVPPLVQGDKNETLVINATFGSFSGENRDWKSINGDLRGFRMVNFNVKMKTSIRSDKHHWWDKLISYSKINIKADCPDLLVSVFANSNGGSLFGGSKPCTITWF